MKLKSWNLAEKNTNEIDLQREIGITNEFNSGFMTAGTKLASGTANTFELFESNLLSYGNESGLS